jgi:hypothetical protein
MGGYDGEVERWGDGDVGEFIFGDDFRCWI